MFGVISDGLCLGLFSMVGVWIIFDGVCLVLFLMVLLHGKTDMPPKAHMQKNIFRICIPYGFKCNI